MKIPQRLLLVEDDSAFRKIYGGLLRDSGYEVSEADDRPTAAAKFEADAFPVVILDLMLPPDGTPQGGLDQLDAFLTARPETKVIVASGTGDSEAAVNAVHRGAYDFLTKPVDPDALLIVVQRAFARALLEAQVRNLESSLHEARPDGSMVGQSESFLAATQLAERVAASDLPVLVTGENGTGKELVARSVHKWSRRADGNFVAVNCGAIPETLMESTFFGHKKGAFTGAVSDRDGLFAQADGGTLFLDEVGDMPPSLQVKVLRALEYGEILPVGADVPSTVDVRVVSATNKDLQKLETEGKFREDLYWRIKGVQIELPPLRDRKSDIRLLAKFFLNRCGHLTPTGKAKLLSDAAVDALEHHAWPGNLRELKHEMQRATVLAGSRAEVQPEDLSFTGAERTQTRPSGAGTTLPEKIEALERREIAAALETNKGNRSRTAAQLGISRQGLLKKMERHGLT